MGNKNKAWNLKNKRFSRERQIIDNLKVIGVYDIFSNRTFNEEILFDEDIQKAKKTIKEKYG